MNESHVYHVHDAVVCRVVSVEEGKRLADQWKAIFLETSAKENQVRLFQLRYHSNNYSCRTNTEI